jgi:cellulose biosynthesis protein BcsQ
MPVALEPVPSMPLVAVVHDDPGTADSLRHAVETTAGWQVLVADPGRAGLAAALAAGPSVALVGCGSLANLPPDCPTPLVAVGDDDHPADVRAALAAGARSLLAWPDGAADLPGELARVAATGRPDPTGGSGGLVIAVRGVQGGAGTTTVAIHLAASWARWGPSPVLLLDLSGGLAFRLDLTAAPNWSDILPVPGAVGGLDPGRRLDAATLLGTLAEPWAGLSVLPLSGLADGVSDPPPDPWAVQSVLEVATTAYRVVVIDLPAAGGPVVGAALSRADALVAVGRCETAGVRGLQAALEAWAAGGHDPDAAGAVVTGVRPQAPLAPREVRAVLGGRLWALIPAAGAELAAAAEDGVLLLDRHDLAAVQAMVTLANRVIPFAAVSA